MLSSGTESPGRAPRCAVPATPPRTASAATPRTPHTPRTPRTPTSARARTPRTASPSCRFIADRRRLDVDAAHYKLVHQRSDENVQRDAAQQAAQPAASKSGSKADYKTAMRSLLFADNSMDKVLDFSPARSSKKPSLAAAAEALVGEGSPSSPQRRKAVPRNIPTTADRILDAPELRVDFYLNLIDWSRGNVIAVALDQTLYLWSAGSGTIQELLSLSGSAYVSSVRFINDEDAIYLAVGTTDGHVEIYDTHTLTKIRTMHGHRGRVAALAWNEHILASGSRDGDIILHDVRARDHVKVHLPSAHHFEVCGLQWSPDGRHLASGGNDNLVNIWTRTGALVRTFNQHTAAVKAISWCPTQPHLLATGGGSQDRCLRIFNVNTGACLACVDTRAQVSAVIWCVCFPLLL